MNELYHYGVEGMKWGVRRYRKTDGTLTPEGRKRYSDQQRQRDRRVYGDRAVRRITKRVNAGESLQSARHPEAVKAATRPGKLRIGVGVAKVALGAGLATAAGLAMTNKTKAGRDIWNTVNRGAKYVAGSIDLGTLGVLGARHNSEAIALAALGGIGGLGIKQLVSGGKDIVYGSRDIQRNRVKVR